MLKKRLIPKLQMRAHQFTRSNRMVLVTTKQFQDPKEVGDPISQAKIYEAQEVDELIFVDIEASLHGRDMVIDVIRRVSEEIFMPITVGGGVRTLCDFTTLLHNGADKVCINSAAVKTPDLINQASDTFGAQCVVVSVDYRKNKMGKYEVWIESGRLNTHIDVFEWVQRVEQRGAGEILLTSIDRDGMRDGLDLELTRNVCEITSLPVITSGGCGSAHHFIEGFLQGKASAVSSGTYFSFRDENPMQTRAQIRNAGIPIRLHN